MKLVARRAFEKEISFRQVFTVDHLFDIGDDGGSKPIDEARFEEGPIGLKDGL